MQEPTGSFMVDWIDHPDGVMCKIRTCEGFPLAIAYHRVGLEEAWQVSFGQGAYRLEKEVIVAMLGQHEEFADRGFSVISHENPPL